MNAQVAEISLPELLPIGRLLAAHCDELEQNFSKARAEYAAIVAQYPNSEVIPNARARLAEFERMDEGYSRVDQTDRAREAPPIERDRRPVPVSRGTLRYPEWVRLCAIQGWVMTRMELDTAGVPQSVRVLDSWPPFVFDEAAIQAVEESRYQPPAPDVDANHTWKIRISFKLERSGRRPAPQPIPYTRAQFARVIFATSAAGTPSKSRAITD
jgi:TonB family protein